MKIWQLVSQKNIQRTVSSDLKISPSTAKVKVTKALLSEADVASFVGALKVQYPLVPGRFAVGIVTEAGEESFMKKGERVYLAPNFEDELAPDGMQTAGQTVDGYYRDFVGAGVFCYDLDGDRSHYNCGIGFRSAYVPGNLLTD